MASLKPLPSPQAYTVGWITALDKELAAATAVLDEEHKKPKGFKKHPRDDNNYAWGKIGEHHVVIACMAAGRYGIVSAATTAMQMVSSLPHLRFGLMVGIGAGVPRLDEGIDIRLGDIVVSQPTGASPGVVQYDLGKLKSNGKFERVGSLAAPPEVLLKGLATLKAFHMRKGSRVSKILEKMFDENYEMGKDGPNGFRHPGVQYDQLFETFRPQDTTTVDNVPSSRGTPSACPSPPHGRERLDPPSDMPKIHYGIIASGNSVVKDGIARDEILKRIEDKCICFEMEAAGLMNNFPCLIIRGICDYADEHKNDRWQNYAAATAAAFTKELLEVMDSEDIEKISPIEESVKELGHEIAGIRVLQNETNSMIQSQGEEVGLWMIQQWLSAPDPSTNYNKALYQRHKGSGDWFLRSQEYSAWKTDRNSFLWLYGMTGCGKTILSSTIIEDLMESPLISEDLDAHLESKFEGRERKHVNDDEAEAQDPTKKQKSDHGRVTGISQRQETHQPKSRSKGICLYFYFDFTDNRKESLENTLRSLIIQLCSQRKGLEIPPGSLYKSCKKGNVQPSIELLRRTFQSMVKKAGEVWIILDALDECQTRKGYPNEGLLGWIDSLRSSREVNVHFLVTSRPEQDIQLVVEGWARKAYTNTVTMPLQSSLIAADIYNYISARIKSSDGFSRWQLLPDVQDDIRTTLAIKAHGMFRWVSCQLDVLENCYDEQTLRKALASLPKTLGETYKRILDNVPDYNRQNTTRILQFLTFSSRSLRIEEAVDAIAVNLEHEPSFDPRYRMPVSMEILRCCSSLVSFSEYTREIRLAHFSVKEFIISREEKGAFTRSLEECTAHESIIEIIVAYLLSLRNADEKSSGSLEKTYYLAKYCASHWVDHAKLVEKTSTTVRERLLKLFSNEKAWFTCNQIRNLDSHRGYHQPGRTPEPLYIASLSGLEYTVKDLLRQEANINADSGTLGSALRAACYNRHSETAKILIDHGANINFVGGDEWHRGTALVTAIDRDLINVACLLVNRGANSDIPGYFGSKGLEIGRPRIRPLHLACKKGSKEVIKCLIDNKTDVNLLDGRYGTALSILSSGGREDLVKLLLDKGAEVSRISFSNKRCDTALGFACFGKQEKVVRLLLENGADVHARNGDGETPLHTAVKRGYKGIAQLLLEHGADVNARFTGGYNLLHKATGERSEVWVQFLLKHGADVHAQSDEFGTPLHLAVWYEHKGIAQLLLEQGANFHAENQNGETPLEMAARRDSWHFLESLRSMIS